MSIAVEVSVEAVTFDCEGDALVGVLHRPAEPLPTGVVLVVGGPQYRVGSHRQFVLLGHDLARAGIACLRFDYRGMGDSAGLPRTFEDVSADIGSATDELLQRVPQVRRVVLWGLCDAASAIFFHAGKDARVVGLVALNPWARTDEGLARSYLKHYYLQRILDPQAWAAILRERKSMTAIARSVLGTLAAAFSSGKARHSGEAAVASARSSPTPDPSTTPAPDRNRPTGSQPLPERMARSLEAFDGETLIILSGDDITAREFVDAAGRSRRWKKLLSRDRVTRRELPEADHTFSRREWRDVVARWTCEWVRSL